MMNKTVYAHTNLGTEEEWDQAIDRLATNNQVAGTHYKQSKIQPIDYIYANNLSYNLGSCLQMVYGTDAKGNKIGDYSIEVSL
jgi:hypothetical protein